MAEQSDPLIQQSELVVFQEEMLRKMVELLKDQCVEQRREVRTMLAAINTSVLTGSITPLAYTSLPPHSPVHPTSPNSIPLHHPDLPRPLTTDHREFLYGRRPRPTKTSPPSTTSTPRPAPTPLPITSCQSTQGRHSRLLWTNQQRGIRRLGRRR